MKAIVISIFILVLVAFAWALKVELGAAPHLMRRFWLGFRRPEISVSNFVEGVNGDLIPHTESAVGQGLVAYAPILLEGLSAKGDFPGEMALITYESPELYEKFRKSPAGAEYQAIHSKYFASEKSGDLAGARLKSVSAVAEPYDGPLAFGHAYFMAPGINDLQSGALTFAVLGRKVSESDSDFLGRIKNYVDRKLEHFCPQGLVDYTFRIERNFVFEYVIWKTEAEKKESSGLVTSWQNENFEVIASGPVEKSEFKNPHLDAGHGVNFQFKAKTP